MCIVNTALRFDDMTDPDGGTTLPHARFRIFIDDSNWDPILEER